MIHHKYFLKCYPRDISASVDNEDVSSDDAKLSLFPTKGHSSHLTCLKFSFSIL